MMIGMDDTIDFFAKIAEILMDNDVEIDKKTEEKYTYAMNRLRYERDKSVGVKKTKVKKIHGIGEYQYCGNCRFDLTIDPHFKFCPHCGYRIKDY